MSQGNSAIFYHPEGFDTGGKQLMGRHAAGESFLHAYARHGSTERLFCYAARKAHYEDFKTRVAAGAGRELRARWIPHGQEDALAEPGCLFYPSPNFQELSWHRRHGGPRRYSLTGVTHTTATHTAMDAMGATLVAPYESWDAVICTSQAVRRMVERSTEQYRDYLATRLGGEPPAPRCQFPVIPLGVEMSRFPPRSEKLDARERIRRDCGLDADEVAVLYMGRLNWHAKAHPFPMALALQAAARATGVRAALLLAGWFPNDSIETSFRDMLAATCPDVRCHILDGRKPDIRADVWFAADIFCSLSDNIQETFGLTPVEGMAAGLPCVVTEWNGYRETVRHGQEGFAVSTVMPPRGAGSLLARRHAMGLDNYDHYVGYASQVTAVNVPEATEAFGALLASADLRQRMGEAGRRRAASIFGWHQIVPQYEALWAELAERRTTDAEVAPRGPNAPPHPLREDPFTLFGHYPTQQLDTASVLLATERTTVDYCNWAAGLAMNRFARTHLLADEALTALIRTLAEARRLPLDAVLALGLGDSGRVTRTVVWLAKLDVIGLEP
ncbi:MAG: glycosyltransferase family 4 protein [Salinisphaeraceae bacterium]